MGDDESIRVLQHFLLGSRCRSQKSISSYALSYTAASIAAKDTEMAALQMIGLCCSRKSINNYAKEWFQYEPKAPDNKIFSKMKLALSPSLFTLSVYDNCQGNQRIIQRAGHTSDFTKGTVQAIVKTSLIEIPKRSMVVPITYIDQVIPSTAGMFPFEALKNTHDCIVAMDPEKTQLVAHPEIDITGKRLSTYMKALKQACNYGKSIDLFNRNYVKQNDCLPDSFSDLPRKLIKLLRDAACFQARTVKSWRGEEEVTEIMLFPISSVDETKIESNGGILVNTEYLCGMIRKEWDNKKNRVIFKAVDDIDQRWLIMIGDGLTVQRILQYRDRLAPKEIHSFAENYEQVRDLRVALGHIAIVPGDLHAGGFHFLQPIFDLFFPALIQPIQAKMQWKRLKYRDVSQSYKVAVDVSGLCCEAIELFLFWVFSNAYFVANKKQQTNRKDCWTEDNAKLFYKSYAEVANKFETYLERLRTSPDQCFRLLANYVHMYRLFQMFQLAVRTGDGMAIEMYYLTFLPIWYAMGKNNYRDIALFLIEQNYKQLPFHVLEFIRRHRTIVLHKSQSMGGASKHHAIDLLIEFINLGIKKMDFKSTQNQWKTNGILYPLHARAKRMALELYKSSKTRQLKKPTTMPRRELDIWAIVEILDKSIGVVVKPLRLMTTKLIWDILPSLETKLVRELKGQPTVVGVEGTGTAFGADANSQIENQLRQILGDDDIAEEEKDEEMIDGEVENDDDEGNRGNVEPTPPPLTTNNTRDSSKKAKRRELAGRAKVVIGPEKKVLYVFMKQLEQKALTDIEQIGKDQMEKAKVVEIRNCMKSRKEREGSYLYDRLYDYIKNNSAEESLKLDEWMEEDDDEADAFVMKKMWDAKNMR
jgi:hypothetical protein